MKIINIDPVTDPIWEKLVNDRNSDVFHSPGWCKVLSETYGFNVRALVSMDANAPKSGIVYCQIEDMLNPRTVSLPFSDYCDPIVSEKKDWAQLIDKIAGFGSTIKIRCLHNDLPLTDDRFKIINHAKWHNVNLNSDLEVIWQNLHPSSRRAIRKAQKSGVTIRRGDEADLRKFFEIHLKTRKSKYRLLAQPYLFFQKIWQYFLDSGKGALLVADYNGEVIAGVLYLVWKQGLYYKFNASLEEYQQLRPNDLLMWEGIKYGQSKGLDFLDLGLSDREQEGLLNYKKKYATSEKTISFLQYVNGSADDDNDRKIRELLPQLTDLFTDRTVSDKITEQAGEVLYRYFT